MIVSIHQAGYLPWPGYFHRLALSDVHVIFDDVQFEKNGLNNRNRIGTPQGPLWLTVPVRTGGRFGNNLLKDVEIADGRWRRAHWKTLSQNYRKTPHFAEHEPFLEDVYRRDWPRLLPLNVELIGYFLRVLGLETRLVYASELGVTGEKSDRVLNLCRAVGATTYISGALGRDYLEVPKFEAAGIAVAFQDYRFPSYPQAHETPASNLSIVDLVFNQGPRSLDILLSGNATRGDLPKTAHPLR